MNHLDVQYINRISSLLDKFSVRRNNLYNFRCPYCGDSQRNKNKARGFLYQIKSDTAYKCHNCGKSTTFTRFLKDINSNLYDEYIMERYKRGLTGKGSQTPDPKFEFDKPKFKASIKLPKASTNHRASDYLKKRKINPINFYFAEKFKSFCNTLKPNCFTETKNDHSRIVIPLYNYEKELIGIQGRSLDSWVKPKYITIMISDSYEKVYGLDTIDKRLPIYVVEGPFDSTFINNSVALCGSDGNLRCLQGSDLIFVYDNEPRNKEIVDRIDRCISRGSKVIIWPNGIDDKDINDMVMSGIDIDNMLSSNVYSGLQAKLKFNQWKKV